MWSLLMEVISRQRFVEKISYKFWKNSQLPWNPILNVRLKRAPLVFLITGTSPMLPNFIIRKLQTKVKVKSLRAFAGDNLKLPHRWKKGRWYNWSNLGLDFKSISQQLPRGVIRGNEVYQVVGSMGPGRLPCAEDCAIQISKCIGFQRHTLSSPTICHQKV